MNNLLISSLASLSGIKIYPPPTLPSPTAFVTEEALVDTATEWIALGFYQIWLL
jgi:hypothetical protein